MNKPSKNTGFTLIELMIVVAIVAILAAVAYPSYQAHVIRTNRAVANGCLVELSQFMERYYTTNISYLGAALPASDCQNTLAARYVFAFQAAPTANQYTISATPGGAQAVDACGTLSINQAGARTPNTPECW